MVLSDALLGSGSLPESAWSTRAASGPETRTTAIPARPGADDNAQMVSVGTTDEDAHDLIRESSIAFLRRMGNSTRNAGSAVYCPNENR